MTGNHDRGASDSDAYQGQEGDVNKYTNMRKHASAIRPLDYLKYTCILPNVTRSSVFFLREARNQDI